MAVQAQYHPSNSNVLFNRGEEEELKVDMDFPQVPQAFLDQSQGIFFSSGGANGNGNGNAKKRGRESVAAAAMLQHQQQQSLFSLQRGAPVDSQTFISLAQLQNQNQKQTLPLVSTGLRLAFDGQNQNQNQNNQSSVLFSASLSSFYTVLSDELAGPLSQQKDEIDRLLAAQGEQLRRALAERWQRHCRALVVAAEEAAARKMREKEAEVERAARRGAELEGHLARLRAESMAWQAKAMADQAAAAALNAQLQLATAAVLATQHKGDEECGESPEAEDCESAHVDPDRAERQQQRVCRACRGRPASVVLLPCRHLCLCSACDAAAGTTGGGGDGDACPVCRCYRTGSVQVFLS